MYQVILACKGVPVELGPAGALDVVEEFSHRPCHQNVRCEWNGEELVLYAENDWDEDAKGHLVMSSLTLYRPAFLGHLVIRSEIRSVAAVPATNRGKIS